MYCNQYKVCYYIIVEYPLIQLLSLIHISGGKLENILEKLTSNPIKAVLLGAGVTAVIQSSSATTVMVVGLSLIHILKKIHKADKQFNAD